MLGSILYSVSVCSNCIFPVPVILYWFVKSQNNAQAAKYSSHPTIPSSIHQVHSPDHHLSVGLAIYFSALSLLAMLPWPALCRRARRTTAAGMSPQESQSQLQPPGSGLRDPGSAARTWGFLWPTALSHGAGEKDDVEMGEGQGAWIIHQM